MTSKRVPRLLTIFAFSLLALSGCKPSLSPPAPPSDDNIATSIRQDLMSNIVTMGLSSVWKDGVSVKAGVVTLSGAVPDEAYKNVCQKVAADTYGVKSVVNNIKVHSELDAIIRYQNKSAPRTNVDDLK
jgi:BON domain